jgi:hypothetical protein
MKIISYRLIFQLIEKKKCLEIKQEELHTPIFQLKSSPSLPLYIAVCGVDE